MSRAVAYGVIASKVRVNSPVVTIVVVTHNSAQWFARQRAALDAQTERRWRLIVVDNASERDQRPRAVDVPDGAEIVQSEINLGFAEGNNLAARKVTTPYLALLNPDAFPKPDWLATLIATAERIPDAAAIGSTQLSADDETIYDGAGDVLHASGLAYRSNYGRSLGSPLPEGESFAACAAALLLRREAFEQVGGFDPSYFCYFEDVDLCFRLRLRGWRIVQSPDAIIAHVGGGSGATAFAEFHGARNRTWTFVKCMPTPLLAALLPMHLLASALASSVRGSDAWRGFLAGITGWRGAWRARREVQRTKRVSWLAIARNLAWNPLDVLSRRPVIWPIR